MLLTERDALGAVPSVVTYRGNGDALMQDWETFTADQKHASIEAVVTRITVAHVGHGRWPVETQRRKVTFG